MALRTSPGLKNKLLGINTNKLSNGAFASDTTGWTAVTADLTAAAGGQVTNCLQIAESGGAAAGQAYQDVTTKIGHLYRLDVYFKKGTADGGKIMIGTTGDPNAIYESVALTDAAWALKQIWFLATATTTRITFESTDATAGETSLFDEAVLVSLSRSVQDIFKDCFIDIYTGSQPATANLAPSGTLIATIFSDGAAAGLEFDDAVAGVLSKKSTETWSGPGIAPGGTAGWFRLRAAGDLGTQNDTDERIDGAVATSGAELNMSSTAIVTGAVQTINTFTITAS
jgi:hypothetical protein